MTDPHLLDRYRSAGFGSSAPRGVRPAVVVVDLQLGFTDPDLPTGADLRPQLDATAQLLGAARAAGVPVLYTAIAFPPGVPHAWLDKSPGLAALRSGTPAVQIDQAVAPRPDEPVLTKASASGFFGTGLASALGSLRVDTVLVCGATTSGCVRATAVDSVQHGFATLVVADCVGDRARPPHDAALFDLQQKYADVVGLDDAAEYLGRARKAAPSEGSAAHGGAA
ncbi:isochorismatase family protein [Streptomyces xiaopingdaonensis]|uniref:isochorismatase family protein n=1 Tax=Streptomyces xiaopingdaonensis TaxID=1565415 RepID=UPI0002DFBA38|nr:isochorismatase family protein [Streptomyces xiaopingdaonensis]